MDENVGFTRRDLEKLKVKLVLQTEYLFWPVDTAEELGIVKTRITKAVAECLFKSERKAQLLSLLLSTKFIIRDLGYGEEQLEQTFGFHAADVSGNIKVSKDGHGLERL